MDPLVITPALTITPADVERVSRSGVQVTLSEDAKQGVKHCREMLESTLDDQDAHYGINTGFGSLSRVRVARDELQALQRNLIRSHAAGTGDPLPRDVVRGTMFLLACSLSRAKSGVRVELIESILGLLNAGITPVVPESGSVGASGDLAPLAHIAEVLMGEGRALYNDMTVTGADALKGAGLTPLTLEAKEGLALINGTHMMAARFALCAQDLRRVFDAAILANAMSIDAARASHGYLDERVYITRNQPGAMRIAELLRKALSGSTIVTSHATDDPRVQDPYSFRASPLVLGAAMDAIKPSLSALECELGAVTDNPLLFPSETEGVDIVSAGCFHGMPVALPMDTLAVAITHIAGIAERRMYHILSVFDPESRIRAFMSPKPGLMSGFMIVQYSAAAMCNEMIGLCNPSSVANLSTCAGMEDYNSFGPRSAAKLDRIITLARSVIACELLTSAEGIDTHAPNVSGDVVMEGIAKIRGVVKPLQEDRSPAPDIAAIEALIDQGSFDGLSS